MFIFKSFHWLITNFFFIFSNEVIITQFKQIVFETSLFFCIQINYSCFQILAKFNDLVKLVAQIPEWCNSIRFWVHWVHFIMMFWHRRQTYISFRHIVHVTNCQVLQIWTLTERFIPEGVEHNASHGIQDWIQLLEHRRQQRLYKIIRWVSEISIVQGKWICYSIL